MPDDLLSFFFSLPFRPPARDPPSRAPTLTFTRITNVFPEIPLRSELKDLAIPKEYTWVENLA